MIIQSCATTVLISDRDNNDNTELDVYGFFSATEIIMIIQSCATTAC